MKKIFHHGCFLGVMLLLVTSVRAQFLDKELQLRLQDKTKLSDILREANNYLQPKIKVQNGTDPYFKQWKLLNRWALYMSNRLVDDGQITDVNQRNYEAFVKNKMDVNSNARTNSSYGSWSFIGPASVNSSDLRLGIGRCDRITFHPTDPNIIYVGTPAGGLWRSTNDGGSWTSLTNNLPTLGISGIAIDYTNTNVLYVLTGDGDSNMGGFVQDFGYMRTSTGVYKSTDGGSTWTLTGTLSSSAYTGYRLVIDPNDHNTLLAATSIGIYRTTNAGASWTLVTSASKFYDIRYDPNDANRVYAGGSGQVLYSTNSGANWNTASFTPSISSAGRVTLAVSPNNASYVYALTGNVVNYGVFTGLYRSTDNGQTYSQRCNTPNIMDGSQDGSGNGTQASYDLSLAASPSNAERVLTGGVNIWSSTNGGTTMTAIMYDASNNRKIHVDIHDLEYNPLNGVLYCACDGGLYKSTDNGSTWSKLSDGINVSQIYHLAGAASDVNVLALGLQDNGTNSRTTSTSAINHNGNGDGFAVAIKQDTTTKGYAGINKAVYTLDLNGGLTNENTLDNQWYPTLAIHQTNSNIVFAGSLDVFKSTNGGVTYTNKGSNGSWWLTTCPSNSNVIYAAGGNNGYADDNSNGAVHRSGDGGDTWTTVFSTINASFNKITCVGVSPNNSNHIWVTLGGYTDGKKVYATTDQGVNWTNITGTLPNVPVNCIAIDGSENVYVGTDFGVFYKGSGQSDWTPFYTGMPRVPVTELLINSASGVIRAATFGRGVYSASLYSTCASSLTLNGTYGGGDFYEASSTITSAGSVSGGAGTQVFFKAGNSITLSEGFTATAGNEFKAYLGACGNGVPSMRYNAGAIGKLPPPDALDFVNNGFVEVNKVTGNQCTVTINLKNNKQAKLTLADDAGNIVYEYNVDGSEKQLNHVINYNFEQGKMYKAILSVGDVIVHWQEVVLE